MRLVVGLLCFLALATGVLAEGRTCVALCDGRTSTEMETLFGDRWTASAMDTADAPVVTLAIGVTRPAGSAAALKKTFLEVSDPTHTQYMNYLTVDELTTLVAGAEASVEAVRSWLASFPELTGHVVLSRTRDWFVVEDVPAAVASAMFDTPLHVLQSTHAPVAITRAVAAPLTVPASVAAHIRAVHGLTTLPMLRTGRPRPAASPGASLRVTPDIIYATYNFTKTPASKSSGLSLAEFEGQWFSDKDLEVFTKKFGLPNPTVVSLGHKGILGHTEANLDVQMAALAQGVNPLYIDLQSGFNLVAYFQGVINLKTIPMVWSTSYGEDILSIEVSTAQSLDQEFKKLAALGVSCLVASGDTGVYSRGASKSGAFQPTYPSQLPSCTSLGATELDSSGSVVSTTSWSGGGFSPSKFFTRVADAPWQNAAVTAYFNDSGVKMPPIAYYDASGVGAPDLSSLGLDVEIIEGLLPLEVSGTSCASPTAAALIARCNSQLLEEGLGPMGFINPLVYAKAGQITSYVAQGNNAAGGAAGFNAWNGWSPLAGNGQLNYGLMCEAARQAALRAQAARLA